MPILQSRQDSAFMGWAITMQRYIEGHCPGVFEPNQLQKLYQAFDTACQVLTANPSEYVSNLSSQVVREMHASHIISAALAGEFDPVKLSEIGLAHLKRKS